MTQKRSPEQQLEDVLADIRKDGDPRIAEALELMQKISDKNLAQEKRGLAAAIRLAIMIHERVSHKNRR